jgi:hypothetical protein
MFGKGKIVKLVVTTAVSIASHIQLFKEALENKLDDKFHRDNWALSLSIPLALHVSSRLRFAAIKFMALLKIAPLHLIVLGCMRRRQGGKKGRIERQGLTRRTFNTIWR